MYSLHVYKYDTRSYPVFIQINLDIYEKHHLLVKCKERRHLFTSNIMFSTGKLQATNMKNSVPQSFSFLRVQLCLSNNASMLILKQKSNHLCLNCSAVQKQGRHIQALQHL